MRRETIERIFSDRQVKPKNHVYEVPEQVVVSLLVGQNQLTGLPNIVRVTVTDEYLVAESRKGTVTFLEYEVIRAISFDPREIADRQAGFV